VAETSPGVIDTMAVADSTAVQEAPMHVEPTAPPEPDDQLLARLWAVAIRELWKPPDEMARRSMRELFDVARRCTGSVDEALTMFACWIAALAADSPELKQRPEALKARPWLCHPWLPEGLRARDRWLTPDAIERDWNAVGAFDRPTLTDGIGEVDEPHAAAVGLAPAQVEPTAPPTEPDNNLLAKTWSVMIGERWRPTNALQWVAVQQLYQIARARRPASSGEALATYAWWIRYMTTQNPDLVHHPEDLMPRLDLRPKTLPDSVSSSLTREAVEAAWDALGTKRDLGPIGATEGPQPPRDEDQPVLEH
jgi:hypothetical protein